MRTVVSIACLALLTFFHSSEASSDLQQVNRAQNLQRRTNAFPYGKTKVRGVNLGGWLVLEPWITPSIFEATGDKKVIDEFTYGAKYGSVGAAKRLKKHWDKWITENDFKLIASYGLNHVRIPIGHWAWDIDPSAGEQYAQGQLPYLKLAIGWARKYGLKVLIDIHGLPGSQNGFDNSGRTGDVGWPNATSYYERSKAVLQRLVQDFAADSDVVTSIQPVNEPKAGAEYVANTTKSYYDVAYNIIRSVNQDVMISYHNGFRGAAFWKGYKTSSNFTGIGWDIHHYTVFSQKGLSYTVDQRVKAACDRGRTDLAKYDPKFVVIAGEWTPAPTDCVKHLHGRDVPPDYDNSPGGGQYNLGTCDDKTGKGDNFSDEYKATLRRLWEAQVTAFEKYGAGWIQWCWKTEQGADWSYFSGVKGGWIPRKPTQRVYPDPCV